MSPTEFTHSPVIPIAAPFDLTDYPELAGISGISGTGLVTRTATGTYATRTIAVPAAGITISNAGGVAGNPTLALANDLAALEALSSTGIAVRSNTDTWVQRTITGTTNQISVSNGDGVSGNPTLSTPQNIHTGASPTFAGMTLSGMTSGSVLFAGTSGVVSQDNSKLYWDNTNDRLGIGTATPSYNLDVLGNSDQARIGYDVAAYTKINVATTGLCTITPTGAQGAIKIISSWVSGSLLVYASTAGGGIVLNPNVTAGVVDIYSDYLGGSEPTLHLATYTNKATAKGLTIAVSGNVLFGTTTETASQGLIQLATGTTAASGILWGTDTNLYRSAANTLKTDDNVVIGGGGSSANKLLATGTDARIVIDNNGGSGGGLYNYSYGTLAGSIAHTGSSYAVTASISNLILNTAGGGTNSIELRANNTIAARTIYVASAVNYLQFSGNTTTNSPKLLSGGTDTNVGLIIATQGTGDINLATNTSIEQVRVLHTAGATRYLKFTGSNGGNPTIDVSAGSLAITPATVFASTITTIGGATFHTTSTALTNGAGAGAGTLTNAPAAGDPTKWIGINDNGTTRYIPAW